MKSMFAAATIAAFIMAGASAHAQAPAGGFQRCLDAGNTSAHCLARKKAINSGKAVANDSFGRTKKPVAVRRSAK